MRISVKARGGYQGRDDSAELDTNEVDESTASEVEQLVSSAGFFDLPENPWPEDVGADMVRYDIIAVGERSHTVAFLDDDNPEKAGLRVLAERVLALGRR